METYNLSIILDKSEKPKLHAANWGLVAIWFFIAVIGMMSSGTLINIFSLDDWVAYLITAVFGISVFAIIAIAIIMDSKFDKKHQIIGTCTLEMFNSKEVAIFKSNYNEIAVLDFENIISQGGNKSGTKVNDSYTSLSIENKNTTIIFNNLPIKCAIKIIIKDKNLIKYMERVNYI